MVVFVRVLYMSQIEPFNCVQTNDYKIELFVLHCNIWNYLTVCKQMSCVLFENRYLQIIHWQIIFNMYT